MGKHVKRALKRALGGSVGPAPKSNRITGEFRNPEERPHGQPYLRPWYMSPRRAEEAAGTQRPDDGPPIVPRVHSIALSAFAERKSPERADGGPVDEFSSLDPIALEGIRLENRGTSDPKQMEKNAEINRGAVLDNLPVIGNYRAGRRALDAGSDLVTASHYGHRKKSRKAILNLALETAGALSPLPWGRSAGRAASEGSRTANIFAGPGAKTADHAALTRAQELQAAGTDRADIWRETGWFQGREGKWRFEIDDSSMSTDLSKLGPHPSPMMPSSKTGTLPEGFDHPALYDAYPDMRNTELTHSPKSSSAGYFQPGDVESGIPDYIIIGGGSRNPRSSGAHEMQHDVQTREGMAPGGSEINAFPPNDTKSGAWPIYFERMKKITTVMPIEDYSRMARFDKIDDAARASYAEYAAGVEKMKKSGVPLNVQRFAQDNAARDWYMGLAGEVEARNVQSRLDMTADQRRASPPWETQDTPDAAQIIRAKGGQQDVFVPAQPSKTTELAREMRGNDVPNRQIFKQTNRFFGPDGRLRAEVPDKPMGIRRTDMQPGDSAPMGELVNHPSLFSVHPDMRDIPVKFTDPTNARGHPIARTSRDGGFELSAGRDEDFYREQFAKLMNYETGQKGGFGGAVLHDVHDQFKAYDDALRMAEDIATNPKPGDDVGAALAYIERLRPMHQQLSEGVEAYKGVRDIARRGGPAGIDETMELTRLRGMTEDATRNANRSTTGNLESRLVRERSHRTVTGGQNSLARYPYEQGVKIGEVGDNWSKAQVLPGRGMSQDDTARLIEDWQKYGVGNPRKFARGGRVKRAMTKASKILTGAVRGKTTGRSDKLAVSVPPGSYVIPADVVAALGDGNSEAGLAKLEGQFRARKAGYAAGGGVPIQISDGEFVIDPSSVAALGGGDAEYGHSVLDEFVVQTRAEYADHLRNIPGPNQ